MNLTAKGAKALRIIHRAKVESPKQFALLYFDPTALGWSTHVKCGHGSHKGGAMPQAAGAYLAKLVRAGWVGVTEKGHFRREWYLTRAGLDALEGYERVHGRQA